MLYSVARLYYMRLKALRAVVRDGMAFSSARAVTMHASYDLYLRLILHAFVVVNKYWSLIYSRLWKLLFTMSRAT